jgi:Protein of unknown function (DUF2634).
MPDLFPTFDVPSNIENENGTESADFNSGIDFDFEKGDFTTAAGRLQETDGYNVWVQWCIKMISTQRYNCMAYSDQMGVEIPSDICSMESSDAEAQIISTITDALLADPAGRTQSVDSFSFSWGEDNVQVTCAVTAADGATAVLSAAYS